MAVTAAQTQNALVKSFLPAAASGLDIARSFLEVRPTARRLPPVLIQSRSDCEDDPAERSALNQVTQSLGCVGQREALRHEWFDRSGFQQRDDHAPRVSNDR